MSAPGTSGPQTETSRSRSSSSERTLEDASAGPAESTRGRQGISEGSCCGLLHSLGSSDPRKRYVHVRRVASGGMARIYEVWDNNLGRSVAKKVSRVRIDPAAETCLHRSANPMISRFVGEAAVMCHLDHPGVVPVHEIGLQKNQRLFFTMRLIRGETFEEVVRKVHEQREGWNRTRALTVMVTVCETLAHAHGRGVVHRDLKPTNIMIGRHGQVYVMDWGLSHVMGVSLCPSGSCHEPPTPPEVSLNPDRYRTPVGAFIGTPGYMPLEQAEGRPDGHTASVDIYSVGAVLYKLLCGRAPYAGMLGDPVVLVDTLRHRSPDPLPPDVPRELAAICERAMARRPEDRYPDMESLKEDLRAYLENRVVQAHEGGRIRRLGKWYARNPSRAAWCVLALGSMALLVTVLVLVMLRFL